MGIVIINGKKYDSVTGLMLTKQDTARDSVVQTEASFSEQTPDWVTNFVDERPANTAIVSNTINEGLTTKIVVDETNGSPSDTSKTETTAQHHQAANGRRSVLESNTLNRRFVKKPLSEMGNYAKSIAESQAELAESVKAAATPITIAEDAQLDAANKATEDFVPILTRRQAESLDRISNQKSLNERLAEEADKASQDKHQSVKTNIEPTIDLTELQTPTSDDDIMNERLEQLSKILQNVHDLDSQTQAEASLENYLPIESVKRSTKRKFRRPAILSTLGALAAIAAIGVYVALPSVNIRMAANKAGIDAKNPYIPEGFSIDGEVAYQSGRITINYKSNSGSDGYSITQEQNESLTEQAVVDEATSRGNGNYQTMQAGNKTVYRYRDVATWLDGDMKYTINTNDYLDSQDIANIVNSLQ